MKDKIKKEIKNVRRVLSSMNKGHLTLLHPEASEGPSLLSVPCPDPCSQPEGTPIRL